MKTLKKINLLNLSQTEMAKRQESMLKGGYVLPCVCVFGCACNYGTTQSGMDEAFSVEGSSASLKEDKTPGGETGVNLTYDPIP